MQANQILKKDQKKENTSIFSSTLFAFKETIQIFISLCIIIENPESILSTLKYIELDIFVIIVNYCEKVH